MSDTPEPASDVLDQSEVDELLTAQTDATPRPAVLPSAAQNGRRVERHDFRQPVLLTEAELRRLRLLHDEFGRYLSARLSLQFRMEFGLRVAALATMTYSQFTHALATPTHLSLFKIEPLVGVGMLEINPRLALAMADRLLGGPGRATKADRPLTEIEVTLIEEVVAIVLEEWCGPLKGEEALRPAIIGHESNGRFLQTASRDDVLLTLTLECTFGDCAEQIQLGIPYYTIEPLVKNLQARRRQDMTDTSSPRRAEWQASYNRIHVPVRAEWQAFELTLGELTSLRPGDVIEMPATLMTETQVLLNGTPKFVGTVGLNGDRVAVEISRKLSPEETTHANSDGRKVP